MKKHNFENKPESYNEGPPQKDYYKDADKEDDERKKLLKQLPKELQEKNANKSTEDLRKLINQRKQFGGVSSIKYGVHPKTGTVLTEKEVEEMIKNRLEDPTEKEF